MTRDSEAAPGTMTRTGRPPAGGGGIISEAELECHPGHRAVGRTDRQSRSEYGRRSLSKHGRLSL